MPITFIGFGQTNVELVTKVTTSHLDRFIKVPTVNVRRYKDFAVNNALFKFWEGFETINFKFFKNFLLVTSFQ